MLEHDDNRAAPGAQPASPQTQLEQAQARLAELEREATAMRQRVLIVEQALAARTRENVEQTNARAQLEAEVQARIAQVEALMSSTSWRVTAPLRGAVEFLRTGRISPRQAGPSSSTAGHGPGVLEEAALRQARKQVQHLKARLLKLGFEQRASADFRALIADPSASPYARALASWEFGVWQVNRGDREGAAEALRLLDGAAASDAEGEAFMRRAAVLRAESHHLLGDAAAAAEVLNNALEAGPHADLFLARSRLEADESVRLEWINRALMLHGLAPADFSESGATVYDRLRAQAPTVDSDAAKVSIIIPAYNAETTIGTALASLLDQTWRNVEILVSDDCSLDRTAEVVQGFAERDPRVRLVHGERNAGPYVARNKALAVATGDFVTCNDSDDWSHPEKIAIQARHLLGTPEAVCNTSPQARTSEELIFSRRGNPGFYIQPNMSSLMFRRGPVVERIGYWDSVRFAADSEYTRRIKAVFGKSAFADLDAGPLSFQRQTETSLTGSQAFGYAGYKMGARLEYEDGHRRFHESKQLLHVGFPLTARPFPVPEPMHPEREPLVDGRRHFDVVMVSDFRLPGGNNMSNIEEIKAQKRMGLRTGLIQMSRYDVSPERQMNGQVAAQVDGDQVQVLVYGEKISCDMLVLRLPWVLEEWQERIPDVKAEQVRVIVNQPPHRDYGADSEAIYHIPRCAAHLERHFGQRGTWHPIGPLVRQALIEHHAEDLKHIELGEDWPNIIDTAEWRRAFRPARLDRIRICRHSRDQYVKWPADRETLLKVYPDTDRHEVHILGGAETPRQILGGGVLPKNWRATGFGKMSPASFLSKFDVFVYYTHPDWVESFGRVIFEAMAVGLPVILPPVYRPVFGEAAIYAEPDDVQAVIDQLMDDPALYQTQVLKALAHVETRFGHQVHAARLSEAIGRELTARMPAAAVPSEDALDGDCAAYTSFSAQALAGAVSAGGARRALVRTLLAEADEAMERGPYSVVDKTTLPPSGNRHDYWHPAPYWHPNPDTFDGLPFIRKDGVRVEGTVMYEPESDKYDRTRLQKLFDDSTMLALAWKLSGRAAYAEKAADHLRRWFLDPATRMNPHLSCSQVKPGHNRNRGSSSGVIEMKDLYYYLDAVRMVAEAGALSETDLDGFRAWLREYALWLVKSDQGQGERGAGNNHGLYYDLQLAAIAAYLDERALLRRSFMDAVSRIPGHFDPDGSQPEELERTTTAHYCCFNFQGWANLATLAERWGVDLWGYETHDGRGLRKGAEWLLGHAGSPWPYPQIDEFDTERFIPIWFALPERMRPSRPAGVPDNAETVKPRFYPHDGIRPYWNL